jgi:hypothetical protein
MTATLPSTIHSAVYDHFNLPEEIARLAAAARYDLWFGPIGEEPDGDGWLYPGFGAAADRLQRWAEEHLSDVWIGEESGCLLTSEPEAGYWDGEDWVEEWETFVHLSLREVAQAVFGRELANHIWL